MDHKFGHPYMPNRASEIKKQMMDDLGIKAVEDLYGQRIKGELRYKGKMNLPEPIVGENAIKQHVNSILKKNITCEEYACFLGAGCYNHHVPAVCDEMAQRGEFLTGYCGDTYSDHGKMQAIFEYASQMAELLDKDQVSYTNYDGSQAVASSVRTCVRVFEARGEMDRNQVLIPSTMNPEILSMMKEFCRLACELVPVKACDKTGRMDMEDLKAKLASGKVACVFFENPSYLGFFEEQAKEICDLAHKAGALTVVQPDLASLGVIETPANYGADIVCGDIQPLGMHMQYGGGCGGFIAVDNDPEVIEQLPTYLYGLCKTEVEGEYGWGRALYYRNSHGAREKAREYFGTETGLYCITAGVYMALMGPEGFRELGESILQKCAYAMKKLAEVPGVKANLLGGCNFQEFVVNFDGTGKTVDQINEALLGYEIFGGKDISADFPQFGQSALYAVTEKTSQAQIDALAAALKEIVGGCK